MKKRQSSRFILIFVVIVFSIPCFAGTDVQTIFVGEPGVYGTTAKVLIKCSAKNYAFELNGSQVNDYWFSLLMKLKDYTPDQDHFNIVSDGDVKLYTDEAGDWYKVTRISLTE